jgi:hypothetical protein
MDGWILCLVKPKSKIIIRLFSYTYISDFYFICYLKTSLSMLFIYASELLKLVALVYAVYLQYFVAEELTFVDPRQRYVLQKTPVRPRS